MFGGNFYDDDDALMSNYGLSARAPSGPRRRFDAYFTCYPIAALDRKELNYGGKIIMPPSALEKLSKLHISYPMLFELHNGRQSKMTHAGVLEFIAEEGRVYLPYWMMQTLKLEPGSLVQIKSTDLPSGSFIKLQPQSMAFINAISDPKAVLENVLRNFSALTKNDKFQFSYNDDVFEIAVLEVKPGNASGAISCVETDIEVDFAPPLDYVEPVRSAPPSAGSSRPGSVVGGGRVTPITQEGSMAKAIGFSSLAANAANSSVSAFAGSGQKLKGSRTGTPTAKPSTPVAGTSTNPPPAPFLTAKKSSGPQPLRLPPGKLFFGYTIKPVKKDGDKDAEEKKPSMFSGGGQSLRGAATKKRKGDTDVKGKGRSKADPIDLD